MLTPYTHFGLTSANLMVLPTSLKMLSHRPWEFCRVCEIRTHGPHYHCAVTGFQDQQLKPNSLNTRWSTGLELNQYSSGSMPPGFFICLPVVGRDSRTRTCDLVLPKHAYYQLYYIPITKTFDFQRLQSCFGYPLLSPDCL